MATMVCPPNSSAYWSLPVARTFIQDPTQVPRDPRITDQRRPCKKIKKKQNRESEQEQTLFNDLRQDIAVKKDNYID